jgi:hypothetical protein
MQKLVNKIAQIGYAFEKNGKDADNDRILLEGVHNNYKT